MYLNNGMTKLRSNTVKFFFFLQRNASHLDQERHNLTAEDCDPLHTFSWCAAKAKPSCPLKTQQTLCVSAELP